MGSNGERYGWKPNVWGTNGARETQEAEGSVGKGKAGDEECVGGAQCMLLS